MADELSASTMGRYSDSDHTHVLCLYRPRAHNLHNVSKKATGIPYLYGVELFEEGGYARP